MNPIYLLLISPIVFAVIVSFTLTVVFWRRSIESKKAYYALMVLAIGVWALTYLLEITSATPGMKLFFSNAKYVSIVSAPVLWLLFALDYTEHERWLTRRNLVLLCVIPFLTLLFVSTNDLHGLMWGQVTIDTNGYFSLITKTYHVWFWVHTAYCYLLLISGTLVLSRALIRSPQIYRRQRIILLVSVCLPWIGNILHLLRLSPFSGLDLTVFAFCLAGLAIVWGMLRFQLLNLAPVARDAIIDNMRDGVIVLDAQNRIVDLNLAAQRFIGSAASQAIGKPAMRVLSPWQDIARRYSDVMEANGEIIVGTGAAQEYFYLRISPLHDRRNRFLGRMILLRDITDAKRTRTSLRLLEKATETMTLGVTIADLEGKIIYLNPAEAQLHGYPLTELVGRPASMLGTPAIRTPLDKEALRHMTSWVRESVNLRKDGSEFPVELVSDAVKDDRGEPIGIVTTCLDITERKRAEQALRQLNEELEARVAARTVALEHELGERRRAEEALRQSEELFRVAFENTLVGMVFTSPTGQLLRVNDAFCQMLGYSSAELHQVEFRVLTHPDDQALSYDYLRRLLQGEFRTCRFEKRYLHKNGQPVWVDIGVSLVKDADGKPLHFVTYTQDITERKRAEDTLLKFRLGIERSGEAIFMTEVDGTIVYVNPAFEKTYGYSRAESIGKTPRILKSGVLGSEVYKEFWDTLLAKRSVIGEIINRTQDGRLITTEGSANPILDERGEIIGFLAIQRDITERKRAEQQLIKLNECLLSFGADPLDNINRLTALGGELLEADCALYNRLDEGMLCSWGQWHTPMGYHPLDKPEGHICLDVIQQGSEQPLIVRHLPETPYAHSDPNVVPYRLQTYIGQAVKFENRFVGSLCMVYQRDFVPTENQQRLMGIIASAIAVEEKRKYAEEALRKSEERYALAASGANDGLWDWDLIKNEIYYSPRLKSMLGYAENKILSSPDLWFDSIHPEDVMRVREEISSHLRGVTSCLQSEHRIRHVDGTYLWILARGLAVRHEAGTAYRMAGSFSDITARKRAEEQLIHDALHDELTGLANRMLLTDRLERALERALRRKEYTFAVLYLDLDHFKWVNDSLGHTAGDRLLTITAQRLQSCVRALDTVARLGGDEFVVLLDDLENTRAAIHTAERIQNELSKPIEIDGQRVFNSASIGIVLNSTPHNKSEEILRDADIAMYHAKSLGRARHAIFDAEMRAAAMARLEIEIDLRGALERQEFRVYYQPIISLTDNHLVGLEALVRWQHPCRGLVLPSEFISLAEETGLIIPIGHWIIREACRQMREWQIRFANQPPIAVHVNLSAKQFNDPNLATTIEEALRETGLAPSSLSLEITESVLMENHHVAAQVLSRLRAMGIQVELDDFGTGYSSLSYLHQFPIDVLKVDRMFIHQVRTDGSSPEIVETIIKLGHSLGMRVVAEGLETSIQLEQLKKLGCDFGQGFYFAEPIETDAIEALLKTSATIRLDSPDH